jgi:hypothetical protein
MRNLDKPGEREVFASAEAVAMGCGERPDRPGLRD